MLKRTMLTLSLSILACDSPDDEMMLEALDEEAELEVNEEPDAEESAASEREEPLDDGSNDLLSTPEVDAQAGVSGTVIAQKAINFALSQRSSLVGSVYTGCAADNNRKGGTSGGYHVGSGCGQSNYYQAPGRPGWDCSGLVYMAFKQAGIDYWWLGSTASALDSNGEKLTQVTPANRKPGDIVLKKGHVAIYVGDIDNDGSHEIVEATPYGNKGTVWKNGVEYRNNWDGVRHVENMGGYTVVYDNDPSTYGYYRIAGVQDGPAQPPPPPPPTGWGPLYRYYNSAATDHFYTRNWNVLGSGANGYVYERPEGQISGTQLSGTVPLYQLYKPGHDHFYTTSAAEKSNAQAGGWSYEGVAGYVLPANSAQAGAKPIYRYWNGPSSDHFYTLTSGSYSGYTYEFVGWKSP